MRSFTCLVRVIITPTLKHYHVNSAFIKNAIISLLIYKESYFIHVICIYFLTQYWCPTTFPYQIMLMSFNYHTTGVTSGARTANTSGALEFFLGFKRGLCWTIFSSLGNVVYIIVCSFSFGHCIVWLITPWYLQKRFSCIIYKW